MEVPCGSRRPLGTVLKFSLRIGHGNRTGLIWTDPSATCAARVIDKGMLLLLGHGNRTGNGAIPYVSLGHGNRTGYGALIACKPMQCPDVTITSMTEGISSEASARISAGNFNGFCCATAFASSSCRFCRCYLLPTLPLPISATAIKTTATSVVKFVNMEQLRQILRVSIVRSGCSTFSYVHPMRALVYLGELKVVALIDTGSDYDAIDRDLSLVQGERGN